MNATPRPWHLLPLSKTIVGPDNHTVVASFRNGADAALSHEAVNAHARLAAMEDAGPELLGWARTAAVFVQLRADGGAFDAKETIGPLRKAIADYEEASTCGS